MTYPDPMTTTDFETIQRRMLRNPELFSNDSHKLCAEVKRLRTENATMKQVWCLCPPGCVSCHGDDCECYEHQPGTPAHELKARVTRLTADNSRLLLVNEDLQHQLDETRRMRDAYQQASQIDRDAARRRVRELEARLNELGDER